MGQLETAGPQVGQIVYYTATPGAAFVVGIITLVTASNGLVQITTIQPGGTFVNQANVKYDGTGTLANSWRYPDIGTGI